MGARRAAVGQTARSRPLRDVQPAPSRQATRPALWYPTGADVDRPPDLLQRLASL